MSTSRTRNLREKNELTRLIKSLDKRMTDFESSVEDLKLLKESLTDMADELADKKEHTELELKKLENDLQDNKHRILNDAAKSINKVIISEEDLNELHKEIQKLKNKNKIELDAVKDDIDRRVNEEVAQKLKFQELEHNVEKAKLEADFSTAKKEVENLKETIKRMADELESQKKMTASIAGINRNTEKEK